MCNTLQVGELLRRHGELGLPRLDPEEDLGVKGPRLAEVSSRRGWFQRLVAHTYMS